MSKGSSRISAALNSAAILLMLSLCACIANPTMMQEERDKTLQWGMAHQFKKIEFPVGQFTLLALARGHTTEWTVYIEGDGAAWPTPFHPPADPTPRQPIALHMAAADPAPSVLYLGRPCQFLEKIALSACAPEYWMSRRFSPEVIESYQQQLSFFKEQLKVTRFRLVGYSGGGVIATLLAAKRDDVEHLITVASPLSLAAWVKQQQLTPLTGSLDPAKEIHHTISDSWHFVGTKDQTVPPLVVNDFVSKTGGKLLTINEFDHDCCWLTNWPALLEKTR